MKLTKKKDGRKHSYFIKFKGWTKPVYDNCYREYVKEIRFKVKRSMDIFLTREF